MSEQVHGSCGGFGQEIVASAELCYEGAGHVAVKVNGRTGEPEPYPCGPIARAPQEVTGTTVIPGWRIWAVKHRPDFHRALEQLETAAHDIECRLIDEFFTREIDPENPSV